MKIKIMGALLGSLLLLSYGCNSKNHPEPDFKVKELTPPPSFSDTAVETKALSSAAAESDLEKGKRLYVSNCLQCHNKDPNIKGPIGPEIVDAPLEVMTVKVMTGKYPEQLPPGFVPKRKSRAMRAIPKLKDDIPAIWAYVQSVKKK